MSLCETLKANINDRYINLFENMPLGCLVINLAGDIVDVNPKALEILGSPSSEETKKINMLSFPPLVEAGISDLIRRSLSGEEKIIDDIIYTSAWGKTSVIRFTAVPLYDEKNYVCFSLVMMEDLSEYNQLKCELERNNKMLRIVIDSIPSLIWLKDNTGKYLFTNKAFDKFNSFLTSESIIGKTDYEVWPKDQANSFSDEDTLVRSCDYQIEKLDPVLHPDLGLKYYKTIKLGVCDENKNSVGVVGISCDVSKQHEQDQILAKALETLTNTLNENTYVK
jgi:PAS domain S-box-containing protein